MICFLGCSKGWRTLRNSKGFFGNTFSEMKRGWEGVPLLWKAKVETYRTLLHNRNYSRTICRQPVDGWTVPVTRFLTKLPVISAKLTVHVTSDNNSGKADRLVISESRPAFEKGNGFWERNGSSRKESGSSIYERAPLRSSSERVFDLWGAPLNFFFL